MAFETALSIYDFFISPRVTTAFMLMRQGVPGWSRRWIGAMTSMGDLVLDGARAALGAGFPADCPDDALDLVGIDSQIERNPYENDAAYRLRLRNRFPTWTQSGRAGAAPGAEGGVTLALQDLGLKAVRALDMGHGWVFDDSYLVNPWRFHVLLEQPHNYEPLIAGSSEAVAGDAVAGITMTFTILRQMRRLIRKWKSAHALGMEILVVFSGVIAGPETIAGDGTIAGCEMVRIPIGLVAGYPAAASAGPAIFAGYFIEPF